MAPKKNPQPRALVIEDDDVFADHLALLMQKMDFIVEISHDGLDALGRCQSHRFDVIVCDVRMPRLSGLSFLSNLRQTLNATTRVVMISALDDNAIRDQSLASGAAAYLVKPIHAQDLRGAIGELNFKL